MVFKSRWTIDIPDCSLPTYIFGGPDTPVSKDGKIYIDANNPDTHYLNAHDVRLWSQRFAAGLRKSGVQDGDRILLFSPNHIFYPVAFLGIIMAGGIFTGANPTYTARELAYQLKDSSARCLLCADEAIDTGLEAAKSIGMGKENIFIVNADLYEGKGSSVKGCKYWSELFASAKEGSRFVWDDLRSPGACHKTLALNYSSGTTGPPKGVEITHRNYVANIMQGTVRTGQPSAPTGSNRVLSALPLYHAMGQVGTIGIALSIGAEVYMMPKFNFEEYLRNIERFKIGQMVLVPPMAVALTRSPFLRQIDLSSIERVNCGAAPLGLEVTREVEALFGHKLFLRQGWGLSEATCAVTGWDPEEKGTSAAVGELLANCEAKIMADDGVTELGVNQRGEIWVRGPNVMKGYWQKPEATKKTMSEDGKWLKTGDVAYFDEHLKVHIVDRIKELIKVKGNQVAPAELEGLLLDHSAVADAAVIGITKDHEEYPRAYIVAQPGHKPSEKDIVEFIASRVHRTKRLTGGVRFVDAIPKNPSGKILRRALREQERQESLDHGPPQSKL